jgi:sigma-54-specific transcriptional regulator
MRSYSPIHYGAERGRSSMTDSMEMQLERLLVGTSEPMRRLRKTILRTARARLSVLIQGPTGSGKELVARGLHIASGRTGSFVAFNVCAIGDTMFEDALFGHVKGAFTGAMGDSPGYLAEANGGTVFLDEVNALALPAQAKLLRVIETGSFRAVGAARDRCSDFRVIAATNDDLGLAVSRGTFRCDLLYRLSGALIVVPPLRTRREDIPALARHLLGADDARGVPEVGADALRRLQQHDWPGNVRELKHVLERATLQTDAATLRGTDIESALLPGFHEAQVDGIDRLARQRLITVLESCSWDTAAAASRLGVNRSTIYRRMQRLGIDGTPDRLMSDHRVLALPSRMGDDSERQASAI